MDIGTRMELANIFQKIGQEMGEEGEAQDDTETLTVAIGLMRVGLALAKGGV